jgi:acyl-CoA dehydrogenase
MDFEDSPEEAKFRAEVRTWLDANAKKRSGRRELNAEDMENGAANEMAASKAWQKTKAKSG